MRSSVRQITPKSLTCKTGDTKPILQSPRVFPFHMTVPATRTRMFTLRSGLCQGDPLAPERRRLGAGLGRDLGRLWAQRQLSKGRHGLCPPPPHPPPVSSSDSPGRDPAWAPLAPGSASAGKLPRAASRPLPLPPSLPRARPALRSPLRSPQHPHLPPVLPSLFLNKGLSLTAVIQHFPSLKYTEI